MNYATTHYADGTTTQHKPKHPAGETMPQVTKQKKNPAAPTTPSTPPAPAGPTLEQAALEYANISLSVAQTEARLAQPIANLERMRQAKAEALNLYSYLLNPPMRPQPEADKS